MKMFESGLQAYRTRYRTMIDVQSLISAINGYKSLILLSCGGRPPIQIVGAKIQRFVRVVFSLGGGVLLGIPVPARSIPR